MMMETGCAKQRLNELVRLTANDDIVLLWSDVLVVLEEEATKILLQRVDLIHEFDD